MTPLLAAVLLLAAGLGIIALLGALAYGGGPGLVAYRRIEPGKEA